MEQSDQGLHCYGLKLAGKLLYYPDSSVSQTGRSSPKKRKLTDGKAASEQETKPPVVVVFEDFESFVPRVVQDFITIARYC